MTKLNQIIEKTGYKKIRDWQKSRGYIEINKKQEKIEFQSFLFGISFFPFSLPFLVYLAFYFFPERDQVDIRFLSFPLSLVISGFLGRLYYKIRLPNDHTEQRKLMTQRQHDCRAAVFELSNTPTKITQLFQAFEGEDTIRQNFDLPQLFTESNKVLNSFINSAKNNARSEMEIEMTKILTPILGHYLHYQTIKNGYLSASPPEDIAHYKKALQDADSSYNLDFLCTTSAPLTGSNPRSFMSVGAK